MFNKIFFILFFSVSSTFADVVDVSKQSEMHTKEGVGISTSKRFLQYKIFDLAIDQILLDQGKDVVAFRSALKAKFENQFEPEKNKILARFGDPNKLTNEQRADRDREIYLKDFEVKLSSSNLYNIVTTYSVDKFNSYPEQKKVSMTASVKIDRPGLNQIYQSLVSSNSDSTAGLEQINLYLKVETNLENMQWSDLGLNSETGFTDPLKTSWLAWFEKNKTANIKTVAIYQNEKLGSTDVLLELTSVVSKIYQNKSLNLFKFNLKVDCGLVSGAGNKVVGTCPPAEETKEFTSNDQIANLVANSLYRVPLGAFFEVRKLFSTVAVGDVKFQVILENSVHFDQIQKIQRFLTQKSGELTQLLQMSATSAVIGVATHKKKDDLFSQLLPLTQIPEVGNVNISTKGEDLVIKLN